MIRINGLISQGLNSVLMCSVDVSAFSVSKLWLELILECFDFNYSKNVKTRKNKNNQDFNFDIKPGIQSIW